MPEIRFFPPSAEKEQGGDSEGFREFCRHWYNKYYIRELAEGVLEVPPDIEQDIQKEAQRLLEKIRLGDHIQSLDDLSQLDDGEKWHFRVSAMNYKMESMHNRSAINIDSGIYNTFDALNLSMAAVDKEQQREYYKAMLTALAVDRINKAIGYRKIDPAQEK